MIRERIDLLLCSLQFATDVTSALFERRLSSVEPSLSRRGSARPPLHM